MSMPSFLSPKFAIQRRCEKNLAWEFFREAFKSVGYTDLKEKVGRPQHF